MSRVSSRLSLCVAIAWMVAFWPMARLVADGSGSAAGPSGPISLHFKPPADGLMLASSGARQRVVLDTTRLHAPID